MTYYKVKKSLKYCNLSENELLTKCELKKCGIPEDSAYIDLVSISKRNVFSKHFKRFPKDLSKIIYLTKIDYMRWTMKKYVIEFELENTAVLSRNNLSSFQVDNDLRIEVDTPYKISNLKISEDKKYPEQFIKDLKIELLTKLLDEWGDFVIENEHIFKPKTPPNHEHKYQLSFTIETNDSMIETLVKADTALSHVFYNYNLSVVEK